MDFEEENNNYVKNNIRNEGDEAKVTFIKKILSLSEIPRNFIAHRNANIDNIFYYINDGKKLRRNYILFENNRFHCVYCLCFSPLVENLFVQGVEYVHGCRITNKLKDHDTARNHTLAQNIYLQKSAILNGEGDGILQNPKRNVLRIVLKIIIFLATHGK